ncbi:unnamed protein product [Phytomonas sp. EM1]|nr:unnamed protein product [Phytomonas sp. EM1]|eukprot:CCW64214.1 unnamed protein product [Phytomonas sp. isolate EM1]
MGQCRNTGESCRYRHEADEIRTKVQQVGTAKTALPQAIIQSVYIPSRGQTDESSHEAVCSLQLVEGPSAAMGEELSGAPECATSMQEPLQEQTDTIDNDSLWEEVGDYTSPDNYPSDDTPNDTMGISSEKEMDDFLRLVGIFPDTEPSMLLNLLRLTNGDPNTAVNILERVERMSVNDLDNALSKALAEEEEEESAKERSRCESTDNLLTLHALFPTLEIGTIEAVLGGFNNNLSEAYEVLLCSQEKVTQSDYGTVWGGELNHAEQLSLGKICAMFPEIEPSIVRSIFGNSNKDSSATINCLNQLASELLTPVEREALGREAIRFTPYHDSRSAMCSPKLPDSPRPSRGTMQDSSEISLSIRNEMKKALNMYGDWRRIRKCSYAVNTCRIRVLSQASAAFLRGDGRTAKVLSQKGRDLGAEYQRLNRLAMLALEQERLETDPIMTLDLHGFHVKAALEVLARRVQLCCEKRIPRLTIVIGEGKHTRRGYSVVYRAVVESLKTDPFLSTRVRQVSVKSALVEVRIKFDSNSTR